MDFERRLEALDEKREIVSLHSDCEDCFRKLYHVGSRDAKLTMSVTTNHTSQFGQDTNLRYS